MPRRSGAFVLFDQRAPARKHSPPLWADDVGLELPEGSKPPPQALTRLEDQPDRSRLRVTWVFAFAYVGFAVFATVHDVHQWFNLVLASAGLTSAIIGAIDRKRAKQAREDAGTIQVAEFGQAGRL